MNPHGPGEFAERTERLPSDDACETGTQSVRGASDKDIAQDRGSLPWCQGPERLAIYIERDPGPGTEGGQGISITASPGRGESFEHLIEFHQLAAGDRGNAE
jgi:hypothetical protein